MQTTSETLCPGSSRRCRQEDGSAPGGPQNPTRFEGPWIALFTLQPYIHCFFFTVWKDWASQEADDNLALARYVLKRSRRNEGTRSAPQFCDWLEKKHQSLSVVSPSHFTLHGPACQIWVQVHGRTQVPGAGTRWLSQFGCTVISNSKSVFGISRKKHIFHTIRSQKNKEGRRVTGRVHCFRSAT